MARRGQQSSGEDPQQLVVSRPLDTNDTDNFASVHIECHAPQPRYALIVNHRNIAEMQDNLAAMLPAVVSSNRGCVITLAKQCTHDVRFTEVSGTPGKHRPATTEDRHVICEPENLAKFMGYQNHSPATVDESPKPGIEFQSLSGGQYRRWFVQDQQSGVARKRLQELDALLRTDRQL
jgi:hypothetical protein